MPYATTSQGGHIWHPTPYLQGCVAAGLSKEDVERKMKEAIEFHLEGLQEEGIAIPVPHSYSQYLEVSAWFILIN